MRVMSETLRLVRQLVAGEEVRTSAHGYSELAEDGILATEVIGGVSEGVVVDDYPDFAKGPCVPALQRCDDGGVIHAVWGIPRDTAGPAVLVTAYRPDREKWTDDFLRRKT